MSDILFKAKSTYTKEWVEGYIVNHAGLLWIYTGEVDLLNSYSNGYGTTVYESIKHIIDKNTICQYTGLTDKNGNKIWENDIVKHHFEECFAPIRFGKYQSCFDATKTQHIGFSVDWGRKQALRKDLGYWVNMVECDIVGNALDNPELLDRETN